MKVIKGNVEVLDFGDESMLKYCHDDVNIIKINDIYMFIIENSLVGRVEELDSGLLFHSTYYIESIAEEDSKIKLSTEIKENSENRFRFFPMTETFKPDCLAVNGGIVALNYCDKTGMYEGGFRVGSYLTDLNLNGLLIGSILLIQRKFQTIIIIQAGKDFSNLYP